MRINMIIGDKIYLIHNFYFSEGFCTNTPKNLIRILHETQLKPIFRYYLLFK